MFNNRALKKEKPLASCESARGLDVYLSLKIALGLLVDRFGTLQSASEFL